MSTSANGFRFSRHFFRIMALICASLPLQAWALTTFTLPDAVAGGRLYYPDVQASFPAVDWSTLDRLYIPAGVYENILLGNLPDRSGKRPLVISNAGGQVRVTGAVDSNYLIVINGGANWLLTGQYDAVAQTGHADFPGHAQNHYATSHGRYGIWIDDVSGQPDSASPPAGISVGGGATNFGLKFIEVNGTPSHGVYLLPLAQLAMDGVRVSDLYIHDVEGTGFYAGGGAQPQGEIRGLRMHDNRIARTGAEGIKILQVGGGSRVENNVLYLTSLGWYSYYNPYADSGIVIGSREGSSRIYGNIVVGAGQILMSISPVVVSGDRHDPSDTVEFVGNVFSNGRSMGGYLPSTLPPDVSYRIAGNRFHAVVFQYDRFDGSHSDPQRILYLPPGTGNPISVTDNLWDGPQSLINNVADPNQAQGSISASGNAHVALPDPVFVDTGLPSGFDPFSLSTWSAVTNGAHGSVPVAYAVGEIVSHRAKLYRCIQSNTNAPPDQNPSKWTPLAQPRDDLRLAAGSPYANAGLIDDRIFEHDFDSAF